MKESRRMKVNVRSLSVALVLVLAAVLRVAYLLEYKSRVPYYSELIVDSYYYDQWAQRVVAGKGYGPMPFYMAPLYPYVLAGIYKVFGHDVGIVYVLQMGIGLFNTYLVYVLARRFFGHGAGVAAMVVMNLYGPLVYLESKVLTETLAICLNLLGIVTFLGAIESGRARSFLISGVVLGLSIVCRPNALLTVVLFMIWVVVRCWRWERFWWRSFVPLVLGVVLMIAPVTVRNYVVGKDLVVLTSNGGIVFYQANNPGANGVSTALGGFSGSIMTQQAEEMEIASKALGRSVKPSESAAYWFRRGLEFVREEPGAFAKLIGKKMIWSVHNTEARCSFNIYLERRLVPVLRLLGLPFSILGGIGLYGWICARRRRIPGESVLGIYVVSVFLSLIIFSVSSRYRVPAVPVMAVYAGFGLVHLAHIVRTLDVRGMVLPAVCLLGTHLISLIPYPAPVLAGIDYNNLAYSYRRANRLKEAEIYYRGAIRLNPELAWAHSGLAYTLAKRGRTREAIKEYTEAVRLSPGDADTHFNLGCLFGEIGALDAEIEQYREALRINPRLGEAHINLAVALYSKGDYAGAWKEVDLGKRYGVRVNPDFIKALRLKMPEAGRDGESRSKKG